MQMVNIHEAKTHLSRLVAAIKAGSEAEIIIAQNGIPAARLVPIGKKPDINKLKAVQSEPTSSD